MNSKGEYININNCPFCDSSATEAWYNEYSDEWYVFCLDCKASGPRDISESLSIKRWNKRV